MLDGNRPGRTGGRATADPEIATEIDAHAFRAGRDELGHHDVGGQALADTSGIEADARRKGHGRPVHDDVGATTPERARTPANVGFELVERAVVPGPDHGAEHRRIETTAGEAPRLDGPAHEQHRVGADANTVAGAAVQLADLARRDEAAPALLELGDPRDGGVEQRGVGSDDDEVRVTPHRANARLVHTLAPSNRPGVSGIGSRS